MRDLISQYEEAGAGVSKPRVLLNNAQADQIADKYNVMEEVDKSKVLEDKRDVTTVKREDFLKIVKSDSKVAD